MNNSLPDWNELKNEVGTEFNDFNIIRGKEFISFGKDIWIGYFCHIDGSGGLEIGDNVTFSSGVHVYTHDSSNYRVYDLEKDTKMPANYYNQGDQIYSDGTMQILSSHLNAKFNVIFKDLWPYSLSTLTFDATDTDIDYFTAEASFKYTIYDITDLNNKSLCGCD